MTCLLLLLLFADEAELDPVDDVGEDALDDDAGRPLVPLVGAPTPLRSPPSWNDTEWWWWWWCTTEDEESTTVITSLASPPTPPLPLACTMTLPLLLPPPPPTGVAATPFPLLKELLLARLEIENQGIAYELRIPSCTRTTHRHELHTYVYVFTSRTRSVLLARSHVQTRIATVYESCRRRPPLNSSRAVTASERVRRRRRRRRAGKARRFGRTGRSLA